MFLKRYSYKNNNYWKIVESYRDKETKKILHRDIEYLGKTKEAFDVVRNKKEYQTNSNMLLKLIEQLAIEESYDNFSREDDMDKKVKTAIKYVGGKGRKTNIYHELMPEHKIFVSLFTGGSSIEITKKPSKMEIINDINNDLTNLLLVVRDNAPQLFERASSLPYSPAVFDMLQEKRDIHDPIERACRYLYISRCAFNGAGDRYKTGISLPTANSIKNCAKEYQNAIKRVKVMQQRMKNWIIINEDFEEIIKRFDSEDTFFFADPPYYKREHFYQGCFRNEEHERLNRAAKNIKGKIMICYNEADFIADLYRDFVCVEYEAPVLMNKKKIGESCMVRKEVIYMNYRLEL